jgi:L-iditol 2-dehydrogenase
MTTFEGGFPAVYNPRKILDHPEFRVLNPGEKTPSTANIAAFYNPAHEIHLVEKPVPKPGPGQVLVHVRATGICGSVKFFPLYLIWMVLNTLVKPLKE